MAMTHLYQYKIISKLFKIKLIFFTQFLLLKMNKKLEAIRTLKEKLINMQNQLDKMITTNQDNPEVTIKNYSSTPQCVRAPSNQKWKNPTFWGESPLLGKENKKNIMKKRKRQKQVDLSTTTHELMVNADNRFYIQEEQQVKTTSHTKEPQYINYFKSKRFEHKFFENRRQTPRFQKIKTYAQEPKNPILNPDKQKPTGKRVSPNKGPILSTNLMVTENPRSNPHIYTFADKISSLSPKREKCNKKNKSPNMRSVFNSLERIESPNRKSCKKHYIRYFQETYGTGCI